MSFRVAMRIIWSGYLVVLSFLLLTRDPTMGGRPLLLVLLKHLGLEAHFIALMALTLLTLAARWPVRSWLIVSGLVAYSITSELLQPLFPPRTAQWGDLFQDLAGIAVGLFVGRLAAVAWSRWMERGTKAEAVPPPSQV